MLKSAIKDFPGNLSDINNQLQELQKNNFIAELDANNPAVIHLLATNVLFMEDDDVITPQYKLMQTTIKKYLDGIAPS